VDRRPRGDGVIRVVLAEQRYLTRQPGIVTRSCFASGGHYDPDNLRFARLVAVDEHVLEPAAGFSMHPHRGVDLVTYVLSGTLLHEDEDGTQSVVRAGRLQLQHAGGGIRHSESNASTRDPLQIVQMALLSEDERRDRAAAEFPVLLPAATLTHITGAVELPAGSHHLHVLDGRFALPHSGATLGPGDSVRADVPLSVLGAGSALLWTLS
jgi:redox-sensitive bicupin YhaK (pirin superfamily)